MNISNRLIVSSVSFSVFEDRIVDVELTFDEVFETAIGTTVLCRPYLARALLGWVPRKAGLVDGLDIYYAAWSASQQA